WRGPEVADERLDGAERPLRQRTRRIVEAPAREPPAGAEQVLDEALRRAPLPAVVGSGLSETREHPAEVDVLAERVVGGARRVGVGTRLSRDGHHVEWADEPLGRRKVARELGGQPGDRQLRDALV